MIEQSFRVIDIASKLRRKNMGWMKEAGSCWPWHITFWDHSSECLPIFIVDKSKGMFGWIAPEFLNLYQTKQDLVANILTIVVGNNNNEEMKDGLI
jgi:hypothetical protein|tara:strand:+ start:224 stop:511 length:288 start_codon:yes stop_codon:yes gene_type:complete